MMIDYVYTPEVVDVYPKVQRKRCFEEDLLRGDIVCHNDGRMVVITGGSFPANNWKWRPVLSDNSLGPEEVGGVAFKPLTQAEKDGSMVRSFMIHRLIEIREKRIETLQSHIDELKQGLPVDANIYRWDLAHIVLDR